MKHPLLLCILLSGCATATVEDSTASEATSSEGASSDGPSSEGTSSGDATANTSGGTTSANSSSDSASTGDTEGESTTDGADEPSVGIPPYNPLMGVGWKGSTSLIDYPQTGVVIEGDVIVDIDDGLDGKNPEERLRDAISLLHTNDRVLVRNNSDVTVDLTTAIVRQEDWDTPKQLFAHGVQRIRINAQNVANKDILYFKNAGSEHWKGFELVGTPSAPDAVIMIENSTRILIEDFHIHHNPTGKPVRINGGSDSIVQDSVAWRNGTLGIAHTDVPDGMAASAFSARARFVRNVVINPNDDGFDLWSATESAIIDCVSINAGRYWDNTMAGDGNGFKLGGEPTALGGNWISGSAAINNHISGVTWNWQAGAPLNIEQITTTDNLHGITVGAGAHAVSSVLSFDNLSASGNVNGGQDSIDMNSNVATGNCWNLNNPCPNPQFADPVNGDFSLLPGSPYINTGLEGQTLGASEIALALIKINWTRQ